VNGLPGFFFSRSKYPREGFRITTFKKVVYHYGGPTSQSTKKRKFVIYPVGVELVKFDGFLSSRYIIFLEAVESQKMQTV
jgi:hypothetical protein